MKAVDEITVNGKVYVAADMELLAKLMGIKFPRDPASGTFCGYCLTACKATRCVRISYREENKLSYSQMLPCDYVLSPFYFFLKPEPEPQQPITGESK